jgi:hypothetical protein
MKEMQLLLQLGGRDVRASARPSATQGKTSQKGSFRSASFKPIFGTLKLDLRPCPLLVETIFQYILSKNN